ncbi:MAG: hypothetical protein ACI8UO_003175 [Verrucomicrobiales bacterium]|jgi:hypothetical protein
MKALHTILLTLAGLAFFTQNSEAQINVKLEATKRTYVAHEPIEVVLSITNRAGRDVILGPPTNELGQKTGTSWLRFDIHNNNGHLVSPKRNAVYEPVVIPAGQTLQRKFAINQTHPMSQQGVYRVTASAYFPNLKRYFRTAELNVNVSDGREIWRQVVGVPAGYSGEGSYRRYTLMTFSSGAKKELYFRIHDEKSGAVRATYSLGAVILVRNPEARIDQSNRLHVLHMIAPRTYAHTVLQVDGKIASRDIYREDARRPQLAPSGVGDVVVVNGVPESEANASPLDADIRRLSERPKGLPRINRDTGMPIVENGG